MAKRELTVLEAELVGFPIHGRDGRIAMIRSRLGLSQRDLAEAIRDSGGRATRETVSHWENVRIDGSPRSTLSRRNAEAIVALCAAHGLSLAVGFLREADETPVQKVMRQQAELASKLDRLVDLVTALVTTTDRAHGS